MVRAKVIAVPVLILVCLLAGMLPNSTVNAASLSSLSAPVTPNVNRVISPTSEASDELPYRTDSSLTVTPLPKLGETVELTFTIKVVRSDDKNQPYAGLARSKASLDFYWTNTQGSYSEAYSFVQVPVEEVVESGDFPWQGSYKDGLTLRSQVKLPKEGIWSIQGNFSGEGWLAGAGTRIEVAVADGTAAIMGTEEFKTGPLAYLGNLTYEGGVWPPAMPNEMYPVSLGLDIAKAPRAGEEVNLSCRIRSVISVPEIASSRRSIFITVVS
jgi:hypothetical protein